MGMIVSGNNSCWRRIYVGTILYRLNHAWTQSCIARHNRVWAQLCIYIYTRLVWAQICLGTNMSGHKHVWSQTWWNSLDVTPTNGGPKSADHRWEDYYFKIQATWLKYL